MTFEEPDTYSEYGSSQTDKYCIIRGKRGKIEAGLWIQYQEGNILNKNKKMQENW